MISSILISIPIALKTMDDNYCSVVKGHLCFIRCFQNTFLEYIQKDKYFEAPFEKNFCLNFNIRLVRDKATINVDLIDWFSEDHGYKLYSYAIYECWISKTTFLTSKPYNLKPKKKIFCLKGAISILFIGCQRAILLLQMISFFHIRKCVQ